MDPQQRGLLEESYRALENGECSSTLDHNQSLPALVS